MQTIAIMQPYFLPYIGYWQLLSSVDTFVVYDNIQFTKKGWIHRNRFLQNGHDEFFSIALKAGSDYANVVERQISPSFDRKKMLAQFQNAYLRAPFYKQNFSLIKDIVMSDYINLFDYIYNSIEKIKDFLGVQTKLVISSSVDIDHSLRFQDKVQALCHACDAERYINPIGGHSLYDGRAFKACGSEIKFLLTDDIIYSQFSNDFVPDLSILDVMMLNSQKKIADYLNRFKLIDAP